MNLKCIREMAALCGCARFLSFLLFFYDFCNETYGDASCIFGPYCVARIL